MKNNLFEELRLAWKKKGLLRSMITSQLISGQKDLMFGYAWWLIEPLLLTLVYWFLVSVIFKRGGPDYPLFVLCGIVPYRAFAISVNQSVSALTSSYGLIGQISFPHIYLPVTNVIVNHVKLLFGFLVIGFFSIFYQEKITCTVFFLVLPYVAQILLLCGLSLILSIVGLFFRDLKNLMQFFMRIILYMSPVLYSLDRIPEKYQTLYLINPVASLILCYRDILLYGRLPDPGLLLLCLTEAALLVLLGLWFFSRNDYNILKKL